MKSRPEASNLVEILIILSDYTTDFGVRQRAKESLECGKRRVQGSVKAVNSRRQRSEERGQRSEVRGQRSEVRDQRSVRT